MNDAEVPMSTCAHCGTVKPSELFRKTPSGRASTVECRDCERKRKLKWSKDNPDAHRAAMKRGKLRYAEKHPERVRRSGRKQFLKSKFGLSVEEYDAMFSKQGGLCAICGNKDARRMLAVDHNHDTGKVRGLLCRKCNQAIGALGDSSRGVRAALEYIRKHGE